jgi:MOSC domain-containing protein YiiM
VATETRAWGRVIFDGEELIGDASHHLDAPSLQSAIDAAQDSFVTRGAELDAIVVRGVDGRRSQPFEAQMTVNGGLEGDRWAHGKACPGDQISMMNLDVAAAIANGQSIVLFGDNLFTRLDLSAEALPVGSQLKVGNALLEVSEKPHVPCGQFKGRFGAAAFSAAAKDPRIRGLYLTVIKGGGIAIGDPIRRI